MEKIKHIITNSLLSEKGKDILTVIIVVFVGLGSFELGRLSKQDTSSGVKIEYPTQEASAYSAANSSQTANQNSSTNSTQATRADGKNFFASSRGSKYYPITCSAGKTIKMENRVYFETKAEAETAGYELSSSCK